MDHENQTFFSDILALPPSFYGKIKKNYEIKLFKYWNINANTEKNISEKSCINKVENSFNLYKKSSFIRC